MSLLLHLYHRRWLYPNPAIHDELCQLELLWAWEPMTSSRAFGINESKEPKPGFFNGNQEEEFLFGKIEM